MGPPGSGKGTQATRIAKRLNVQALSTGDLFRDHLGRGTALGKLAQGYMDRGAYVPDDVTIRMVMEWIDSLDQRESFLLDGFPRTEAQAEALDRELDSDGGVDKVLYIRVSEEELTSRLGGRLLCSRCQAPYHSEYTPPARPGVCDRCDGGLYQREDDKPEVVARRIQVYTEETEPVVRYYERAGKLAEVDGETTIENVEEALIAALDRRGDDSGKPGLSL